MFDSALFMIEASGRPTLNARQACAVESALKESGFNVVLILTSTYLDLRDNTTCQLYMRFPTLQILTIDIPSFAVGTLLGTITVISKVIAEKQQFGFDGVIVM